MLGFEHAKVRASGNQHNQHRYAIHQEDDIHIGRHEHDQLMSIFRFSAR